VTPRLRPATTLLFALLASACGTAGPREIVAGDQCNFCRMEITDPKFATQVVLSTGKIQVFDSVECLAGFVAGNPETVIKSAWVADANSGTFVRAEDAGYLLDGTLRGPMGRAVAFAAPADAESAKQRYGGVTVSWAALQADSAGIVAHGAH
jgi:copper chaperone NosL